MVCPKSWTVILLKLLTDDFALQCANRDTSWVRTAGARPAPGNAPSNRTTETTRAARRATETRRWRTTCTLRAVGLVPTYSSGSERSNAKTTVTLDLGDLFTQIENSRFPQSGLRGILFNLHKGKEKTNILHQVLRQFGCLNVNSGV